LISSRAGNDVNRTLWVRVDVQRLHLESAIEHRIRALVSMFVSAQIDIHVELFQYGLHPEERFVDAQPQCLRVTEAVSIRVRTVHRSMPIYDEPVGTVLR